MRYKKWMSLPDSKLNEQQISNKRRIKETLDQQAERLMKKQEQEKAIQKEWDNLLK
jgi:hypothetical protein